MRSTVFLLLCALTLSLGEDHHATVHIDEKEIIGEVDSHYASFTLDWWPNSYAAQGWDDAGILNLDLANPKLVYLASQLQPAHLRIGGTLADTIVYVVEPPQPHYNCTEGLNCLNMTRWNQIVNFVEETGFELVFALNEKYPKGVPGTWDPTNARDLLQYNANHSLPVWGYELGNELNIRKLYPPSAVAKDFHTLRAIINDTFPDPNFRPRLVGPDEVPDVEFLTEFLELAGPVMDAVTYHLYIGYGGDPNLPDQLLDPKFLDRIRTYGSTFSTLIQKYAPNTELWVGESAAAYDSGQNHTTNAFIDGFWYIDQLGTLAQLNHKMFCRQTLVGGNYDVIAKHTFDPNPDYWTVLLWKRLMGTKVFNVTSSDPYLRAYAHCGAQKGVTLAFSNLAQKTSYTVQIDGLTGKLTPRVEYFLTSHDLHSHSIYLNEVLLKLTDDDKIPSLQGKVISDSSAIKVAPLTYGYIHFPTINPDVCLD